MKPLTTVIIPTFNRAELVVKAVESVLNQTYDNIELIVVDDGSTDDTREKLSVYADKIQYIYKTNGGVCSARNVGIKLSHGEYIALLDSDDMYYPEKMELSVQYLREHSDCCFVHTAAHFIDDDERIVDSYSHSQSRFTGRITNRLVLRNFICNSTVVIQKTCFEKAGLFDESMFPPADWDMWLRLSEQGNAGYIDKPLTKYQITSQYVFTHLEESRQEEIRVIEKFFQRNPTLREHLEKRTLSNLYLRYAQCYLLKDNPQRMKDEFLLSLRTNPFNTKALFLFAYYVLAKRQLTAHLRRKILRNESVAAGT